MGVDTKGRPPPPPQKDDDDDERRVVVVFFLITSRARCGLKGPKTPPRAFDIIIIIIVIASYDDFCNGVESV